MNYSRLFNNFCPKRKCGAETIISGIGTGISALTGIADLAESSDARATNVALTREENQKNRDFQSVEAEKNRQFAQSTLNQQMKYNSAPEQVNRLQQAGVNPATAFSNSAGSAGIVTQPSPSSAPAGSSIAPSYNPLNIMSKLGLQGAYIKSLADAYKSSEEGSQVRAMSEAEIANKFAEANLNDLRAQGQETANMIASHTGLKKAQSEIGYMIAQKDYMIAEKARSEAMTNREIEQLVGDVYDNVYKHFQARYGKAKAEMAEIDLKFHQAEVIQNIQTMRSQQIENEASASEHSQNARLRKLEGDIQEFNNNIQTGNIDWNSETQRTKYSAMIKELAKGLDANEKEMAQINRYLETMSKLRGNRFTRVLDNLADYMQVKFGVNILGVPGLGSGGRSVVKGFR